MALCMGLFSPPDPHLISHMSPDTDIQSSQVKQSAHFTFARIFESGHEVPFYQPLAALTLLNRTIHGLDVATGTKPVAGFSSYSTSGTKTSTFFNGNATVQYKVVGMDAVYNTTTNEPNKSKPPGHAGQRGGKRSVEMAKRSVEEREAHEHMWSKRMEGMRGEEVKIIRGRRYNVHGERLMD